jgi:hypothetical protein
MSAKTDAVKDLYFFLDGMFDVYYLDFRFARFVVTNVNRAFWNKTVLPVLPAWVDVHNNAPRGGEYTLYLRELTRGERDLLSVELRRKK